MPLDDLDDDALVAAVASRPEAFAALYRRYERPILGYMVRRTRRADLAADLAAETFASALAGIRRGAGPSGPFAPWLFGIAHHKLSDSHRKGFAEDGARRRLAMEPLELDDAQLTAIDELGRDDQTAALVASLPPQQRDAVIARILDERDYAEIAIEIGCSELVVRKRVSRGLARLRTILEGTAQ